MYEILYKRVCAQTFCSFPAEASSQPKCLTPADTASCTERKTVKSRAIKVKWDRPGAEAEAALTSLWSPWWNHLCPWWDTLSSVLTGSCTGASSQTLGWNPSSPGRLRLNRQTLSFCRMSLRERCEWCGRSLLTVSEHVVDPGLVQLEITLHGNVKDLNNIRWNTRASL